MVTDRQVNLLTSETKMGTPLGTAAAKAGMSASAARKSQFLAWATNRCPGFWANSASLVAGPRCRARLSAVLRFPWQPSRNAFARAAGTRTACSQQDRLRRPVHLTSTAPVTIQRCDDRHRRSRRANALVGALRGEAGSNGRRAGTVVIRTQSRQASHLVPMLGRNEVARQFGRGVLISGPRSRMR